MTESSEHSNEPLTLQNAASSLTYSYSISLLKPSLFHVVTALSSAFSLFQLLTNSLEDSLSVEADRFSASEQMFINLCNPKFCYHVQRTPFSPS